MTQDQETVIKTYEGNQSSATAAFQADAVKMAKLGYVPVSQSYAPGAYGCGTFILALILCVFIIGFLIFLYMLIVKPEGTLTVTYVRQKSEPVKTCPKCAEQVKAAAVVCRFCGYEFPADSIPSNDSRGDDGRSGPASGAESFGRRVGAMFSPKK